MTEKRFTVKPLMFIEECRNGVFEYNGERLTNNEIVRVLNAQHKENQALQRHIKRSTFNKIRVEDVFNCAKYDKFYDNEEAIKSIDWIAKELGVDFE